MNEIPFLSQIRICHIKLVIQFCHHFHLYLSSDWEEGEVNFHLGCLFRRPRGSCWFIFKSSGIIIPNMTLPLLCVKQPHSRSHTVGTHEAARGWALLFAAQGHRRALHQPRDNAVDEGWAWEEPVPTASCGRVGYTAHLDTHLQRGQIVHIPSLLSHNTLCGWVWWGWNHSWALLMCAKHRVFPSLLGGWHWHTTVLPAVTIYSIFTLWEAVQSINLHMSCCRVSFHKLHANNNEQFGGKSWNRIFEVLWETMQ